MNDAVNKKDIKSVSEWLNTKEENLDIQYCIESMEKFEKDAKEMYASYEEFPNDKRRMSKIMNLIKKNKEKLPIYVEKNDNDNFIMEGRHRIVAFYLLGDKEVKVARVSKKIN